MGFLLAIFLQAASCMQMVLFYCHVAFVVCKKWSIFVHGVSWDIQFNSSKASASVLVVVSRLLSLSHCMINLFSGYIS